MILKRIEGSELSSVIFIRDYIQLTFEGDQCDSKLTAFTTPVIRIRNDSVSYRYGESGYCDKMCDLINQTVEAVKEYPDKEVKILFTNGVYFSISLREEDYEGPEAMMFQDNNLNEWEVW
ncbi:hypothetical protein [Thermoactinomyces sp. DSM 45892]|uniref:hypothetical protein n=1 Tax=Thermoactinomyces sp. DSM 45892 TaxID=1882753 RepID=UPI0008960B91|nr:hypothetical protein [Thermoactinomyces sp. DSM 45892]SDZ27057.1 hypothetical protein SAMN05444416_11850 [Thermoactinomyces sp. DSM 45892]